MSNAERICDKVNYYLINAIFHYLFLLMNRC